MMNRLLELYRKTRGGHVLLPENEFQEYAALRKKEYQDRRTELYTDPKVVCGSVKTVKDDAGDIIGFTWAIVPELPELKTIQ